MFGSFGAVAIYNRPRTLVGIIRNNIDFFLLFMYIGGQFKAT